MASRSLYWVNGELVPASKAAVSVCDLAFTRGFGAFESARTYSRVAFRLREHAQRLRKTCELMHLPCPYSVWAISQAVEKTVAANAFPESLIRIYVTGGIARGFVPGDRQGLVVLVDRFRPFPKAQYEKGIALYCSPLERVLPYAKSTNYLSGVIATIKGLEGGFDEAVFVDRRGAILEGTTFSVFAVSKGRLITPESGVLAGITSREVMALADEHGIEVLHRALSPALVRGADEMFITSSNRELIPAVRVGRQRIGDGKPGPMTRELRALYRRRAEKACARIAARRRGR